MSCLISFLNLFFLGTRGLNIPVSLTDTQGDGLHSHDVGFVDGGHACSFVVPGILEGVLSDASASVLGDQFDALNNTVDDLRQQKDKKRTEVTHSWTEHNRINNQTVEGRKRLHLLPETQKEKMDVAEYTSGKLVEISGKRGNSNSGSSCLHTHARNRKRVCCVSQ